MVAGAVARVVGAEPVVADPGAVIDPGPAHPFTQNPGRRRPPGFLRQRGRHYIALVARRAIRSFLPGFSGLASQALSGRGAPLPGSTLGTTLPTGAALAVDRELAVLADVLNGNSATGPAFPARAAIAADPAVFAVRNAMWFDDRPARFRAGAGIPDRVGALPSLSTGPSATTGTSGGDESRVGHPLGHQGDSRRRFAGGTRLPVATHTTGLPRPGLRRVVGCVDRAAVPVVMVGDENQGMSSKLQVVFRRMDDLARDHIQWRFQSGPGPRCDLAKREFVPDLLLESCINNDPVPHVGDRYADNRSDDSC